MRKQATKETAKLERNCIEYSVKFDTGGFVYEQKRSTEFQKATEEETTKPVEVSAQRTRVFEQAML